MAQEDQQWQQVTAFKSSAEYRELLAFLTAEVEKGVAQSLPVERPYSGSTLFDEHWFRNLQTDETWRIIGPDPPYRGTFKRVE